MIGFSRRQWALALLLALLTHLGGLVLYLGTSAPRGAVQAGTGGVTVALGPAGAAPGAIAASPPPTALPEVEVEEQQAADEAVQELPEQNPEAVVPLTEPSDDIEPEEIAEAAPVEEVQESPDRVEELIAETPEAMIPSTEAPLEALSPAALPEIVPLETAPVETVTSTPVQEQNEPAPSEIIAEPPPATVAAESADALETEPQEVVARSPDPEPAPPSAPMPRPPVEQPVAAAPGEEPPTDEPTPEEPADVASLAGAGGEAGTRDAPDAGSGDGASGGGAPGAGADYFAVLQAWLEQHKTYPRRAVSRRQEGVVMLRFVMDRQGHVVEHAIQQSSGYRLLDRAVEALIERAQPLPPMPEEMSETRLTLVVPINFTLQ